MTQPGPKWRVMDYQQAKAHAGELRDHGITLYKLFGGTTKVQRAKAYVEAGITVVMRFWVLKPWGRPAGTWVTPSDQIKMFADVGVQMFELGWNEFNICRRVARQQDPRRSGPDRPRGGGRLGGGPWRQRQRVRRRAALSEQYAGGKCGSPAVLSGDRGRAAKARAGGYGAARGLSPAAAQQPAQHDVDGDQHGHVRRVAVDPGQIQQRLLPVGDGAWL